MKRSVIVRTSFIGFHRWPDAPSRRAYLADLHRHDFHLTVELEVFHNEREVEFHDLQELVAVCRATRIPKTSDLSCEAMAQILGECVADQYPGRHMTVTVSEDNENDARLTFDPDPDDRRQHVHDQ
jgi:hypothetical protein